MIRTVRDAGFSEPSLPRDNGSVVFDEPWQGRAMAIAVLTVERTGHHWDDFRRHLMAAISDEPERPYWESWVEGLDRFLASIDIQAASIG